MKPCTCSGDPYCRCEAHDASDRCLRASVLPVAVVLRRSWWARARQWLRNLRAARCVTCGRRLGVDEEPICDTCRVDESIRILKSLMGDEERRRRLAEAHELAQDRGRPPPTALPGSGQPAPR